jgi:hypothetical protein
MSFRAECRIATFEATDAVEPRLTGGPPAPTNLRPATVQCSLMAHDVAVPRTVALGDALPDLRLGTADGGGLALATLAGRPLVVICIRYYG